MSVLAVTALLTLENPSSGLKQFYDILTFHVISLPFAMCIEYT